MKILFWLVVVVAVFIAYVRFLEATSVFYPSRFIEQTPSVINLPFEDVYFSTQDKVKLNGWLVKVSDSSASNTVLFFHGNAGNIGDRLDKIRMFHNMGFNVFIVDYRGYGNSQGHPTEKGMYRDAKAAWEYLKSRSDISSGKIIGYGESLGGTALADLAVQQPLHAVILDSTLSSAADMAKKILPIVPPAILSVKLDSVSKVKDIKAPKLIIHSETDEMIPFYQSQKLFKAAAEPKVFLKISGGHNDGYDLDRTVYVTGIYDFLKKFNLL